MARKTYLWSTWLATSREPGAKIDKQNNEIKKKVLYKRKTDCYKININIWNTNRNGAEEDRLHEVALTAMKVANDPHLLPYPL